MIPSRHVWFSRVISLAVRSRRNQHPVAWTPPARPWRVREPRAVADQQYTGGQGEKSEPGQEPGRKPVSTWHAGALEFQTDSQQQETTQYEDDCSHEDERCTDGDVRRPYIDRGWRFLHLMSKHRPATLRRQCTARPSPGGKHEANGDSDDAGGERVACTAPGRSAGKVGKHCQHSPGATDHEWCEQQPDGRSVVPR